MQQFKKSCTNFFTRNMYQTSESRYINHMIIKCFLHLLYSLWEKVQKGHADIDSELATNAVINRAGI